MNLPISLTVNGVRRDIELADPRVTLLDLLRERLQLTGTKKGCDRGQCGACTVLVNGRRINSCMALAVSHDGADILTIEGVARGNELHPVQARSEEHTSELQSRRDLVCRLLLEKKKKNNNHRTNIAKKLKLSCILT